MLRFLLGLGALVLGMGIIHKLIQGIDAGTVTLFAGWLLAILLIIVGVFYGLVSWPHTRKT